MPAAPLYQLVWSTKAKSEFKSSLKEAVAVGIGDELIRIMNHLSERLLRDPLEVGEVYRSRGAVEEHLAAKDFLALDFAIDTQRKVVLIRTFSAMSGHGL